MSRTRAGTRAGRVLRSLLLAPVLLPAWTLASLSDLLGFAAHVLAGTVGAVFAVFATLLGEEPGTRWRLVGRRFRSAGRDLASAGVRLARFLGAGPRGKRAPAPGPGLRRPGPRTYPFEDRYRIESLLGSGGSTARLFVVRRVERGRPVGEKRVLKYFDLAEGSRLGEAIRESRGMAVAREMGIVLDHELAGDHFYYVMPYHEGETLTRAAARIHRRRDPSRGLPPADRETCLRWMRELLGILEEYHRRGVIHKDVKPDNVIVTERGVRLVDLGLLTPLASALTLTTHGTEYFRDPEMVKLAVLGKRVREVDAVRFDIYSAGAVLYFLFEGSFPACGPLSRFTRPVPIVLSWIVSRAMAEGAKRYRSAAEMLRDLEAVSASRDPDAMPVRLLPSFSGREVEEEPSPLSPAFREAAPSRRGAGVRFLVSVLLLLAVAVVAWGVLAHRARRAALRRVRGEMPIEVRRVREAADGGSGIVRRYEEWVSRVRNRRGRTGAAVVDPRRQALYVACDGSLPGRVASRRVKAELGEAGVTLVDLSAVASRRDGATGDPDPEEMRKWALAAGSGPAPCVLWIADGGYRPAEDRHLVRLVFYDALEEGDGRWETRVALPGRLPSR